MKHRAFADMYGASKSIAFACLFLALGFGHAAATDPDDLCTGDPCMISTAEEVDPGSLLDFGGRAVILQETLTILDLPTGDVGAITIKAGSFQITGDGQIKGTSSAHKGGSVQIETTGDIALNGARANGAVRLGGNDAGTLTLITSAGSVTATGLLNLDNSSISASGGVLAISAAGSVTLSGKIIATGGSQGGGGSVSVNAGGDIDISGGIHINAGEGGGGDLDLDAGGSVTLGDVDMDGGADTGDGGSGDLVAGGSITLAGVFNGRGADTGERCGDGAEVDFDATGDVIFDAEIDLRARALDCVGGAITVFANDVFINDVARVSGDGTQGEGGSIDIDAANQIVVIGTLELDGADGGAGTLALFAGNDLTVQGTINAQGRSGTSPGALFVQLDSGGTLTLTGDILADGGAGVQGGDVELSACDLEVEPTARISALGMLGAIDMMGRDFIRLRGTFTVGPTGLTTVTYSLQAAPPDVVGATFNGPFTLVLDPLLAPCPACTANADCDDGNACTNDICDSEMHCANPINPTACADGNPCTDDVCSASVCSNPPNTDSCTDGSLCTDGDACSGGSCVPGEPLDCSDGNLCTTDSCAPATGCSSAPILGCSDADGDGKVDDADECVTINWTSPPVNPPDQNPLTFRLNLKHFSGAPGQQGLLFKGLFNPAASALSIDPSLNGVHIYVEDTAGALYDASIPGGLVGSACGTGDGWKVSGSGPQRVWKYRNKSGALPPGCAAGSALGVASVFVRDLRAGGRSAIQFKVKATDATFDHSTMSPPTRLQATLALAAQPSPGVASPQAIQGQCAEALLTGNPIPAGEPKPFCKVKQRNGGVDDISCKGP